MLSDNEIRRCLETGEIFIDDLRPEDIQPNGIDIRMQGQFVNEYGEEIERTIRIGNQIEIEPKEFVLATSACYIRLPDNISALLHTRSSIGRMGILSHTTAGLIDAGFEGEITFELFNCSNTTKRLSLDIPIAQLTFHRLGTPAINPYNGVYQGQINPRPSKYLKRYKKVI